MSEDRKRDDNAYTIRAVDRVCDILDLMLEDTRLAVEARAVAV